MTKLVDGNWVCLHMNIAQVCSQHKTSLQHMVEILIH